MWSISLCKIKANYQCINRQHVSLSFLFGKTKVRLIVCAVSLCLPSEWWLTGSSSRLMNIPSSSAWQPARKRRMMEERVAALALPWNLLPALLRRRPNRILRQSECTAGYVTGEMAIKRKRPPLPIWISNVPKVLISWQSAWVAHQRRRTSSVSGWVWVCAMPPPRPSPRRCWNGQSPLWNVCPPAVSPGSL